MGMFYLSHLKGQAARGGRMRSFSRGIAQFIPRQDPESASLHPKVEGSDLESNESCIYLGLEEEKQFDGYSRKKHQALVGLQS